MIGGKEMEQVQILWVGRSRAKVMAEVKGHSHPYYHLFCISSGELLLSVAGEDIMLQAGQGLVVPENTEHAYVNRSRNETVYLELKFAILSSALNAQMKWMGVCRFDEPAAGLLCEQIVQEYSDLGGQADASAASYLSALIYMLTRVGRYEKRRDFRYIDAENCSPLTQKIVAYLEEHYAENVSLDEMAAALGRGKTNLCVTFKKDTQSTIWNCLNLIRVRRAAELITYGDYSLQQVSTLCGFSSVSHFNRIFVKYVGITPGQCRRAFPADVLMDPARFTGTDRANRFMYSVLAQKHITMEMMLTPEPSADDAGAGGDQDNT